MKANPNVKNCFDNPNIRNRLRTIEKTIHLQCKEGNVLKTIKKDSHPHKVWKETDYYSEGSQGKLTAKAENILGGYSFIVC